MLKKVDFVNHIAQLPSPLPQRFGKGSIDRASRSFFAPLGGCR
jgi:hypothetical protein